MKKIYSILILIIFTISLIMPVTTVYASDDREVVSLVEGESNNIDLIPVWGGNYIQPNIENIDENNPAYFYTSTGIWQRKEGDTWSDEHVSETFRAGTWRYKCYVYINNNEMFSNAGDTHKLADNITVKVNGETWTADPSIINSNNSRAMVYSKEYVINEPEELIVYDSSKLDIGSSRVGIPIKAYSVASYVEGGQKPYTFSKVSGPEWINVSSNGTISGTPTSVGNNGKLTVSIQDSSNPKRTEELEISVAKTEINLNDRETISEVIATSSDIDNIPVCGESLTKPTIVVTSGEPAYFLPSNGKWQKKVNGNWADAYATDTFSYGTWRFRCKVFIDNSGEVPNAGDLYKLADQITVKVNGIQWDADSTNFVEEYHRSSAEVYSQEYYLTEPGTYMVSFESNGGNYIESQIIQKGKKATKPEDPTKAGYAFDGWFKEKTLKNQFDFNVDTISTHTVLYAKWLKLYTINAKTSLDGTNVEKGSVEGTGIFKEGDRVTLKVNVNDDCFFEAWKEDDTVLSKESTYSFIANKDRNIKAIVQRLIDYEVSFATDGGTEVASQTVWTNNPYATKPNNPKKDGFGFDGWYTDNTFKTVFDFKNTKIEHDTIIYAKWHKHALTSIAAKASTCKTVGNIAYYRCTICGKLFKDAGAVQEITLTSTVIPKLAHTTKEEMISKEKTKATLKKDGKIVRNYQTKCTVCGDIISTRKTTEIVYYPKTIKLSKEKFKYNKKVQIPTVIVKDRKGNTIDSKYYTVTYSNKKSKKVGEYSVTIKFSGNYKGTKELKYTIRPQGTKLKKLKSGSKQFKATWNKNTDQTTGYQIQYATNDKFTKNASKELIEDNKKTSNKYKKLKAKKKYYVRIRTYKTVKGKKIYSSWSETLSVKTKK